MTLFFLINLDKELGAIVASFLFINIFLIYLSTIYVFPVEAFPTKITFKSFPNVSAYSFKFFIIFNI